MVSLLSEFEIPLTCDSDIRSFVPLTLTLLLLVNPIVRLSSGSDAHMSVAVWRSGSVLVLINEANLRRARLVLG